MKIQVTGGVGFVGSHLVDALIGKHEVMIYDNFEPQVHRKEPEYLNKNAELIRADMRDKESLKNAVMPTKSSDIEKRRYLQKER